MTRTIDCTDTATGKVYTGTFYLDREGDGMFGYTPSVLRCDGYETGGEPVMYDDLPICVAQFFDGLTKDDFDWSPPGLAHDYD